MVMVSWPTVSTVNKVARPSDLLKTDLTICVQWPLVEEIGMVFSFLTTMFFTGLNPCGVGSFMIYIVKGSSPVLVIVNFLFAGTRTQMPL